MLPLWTFLSYGSVFRKLYYMQILILTYVKLFNVSHKTKISKICSGSYINSGSSTVILNHVINSSEIKLNSIYMSVDVFN